MEDALAKSDTEARRPEGRGFRIPEKVERSLYYVKAPAERGEQKRRGQERPTEAAGLGD